LFNQPGIEIGTVAIASGDETIIVIDIAHTARHGVTARHLALSRQSSPIATRAYAAAGATAHR
jgi:hypothetical protein